MPSPIELSRWTFDCIQLRLPECTNDPDWVTKLATTFYNFVGDSGKEDTGWYSDQAYRDRVYDKLKPTQDHWLSPRMVFRAAYQCNRDVLTNYYLFKQVFLTCRQVVNVTDEENGTVKYLNDGSTVKVKQLTIEKYHNLSSRWHKLNGKNLVDTSSTFPLTDVLWDWFTEYEKSVLIK